MADETTNTDDEELGFAEAMTFLADRVATEEEQYDGDIPNHGPALVVDEAAALLQTATSIEMAYEMADEDDEDDEGPDEEAMNEALLEDVVDLITALAALKHEEDLDIATAVQERMDFIENFKAFEEAMQDAEDRDEKMEVMDEMMTEGIAQELGMGGVPEGGMGPTIGKNVDKEDYDHDEVDKSFQ